MTSQQHSDKKKEDDNEFNFDFVDTFIQENMELVERAKKDDDDRYEMPESYALLTDSQKRTESLKLLIKGCVLNEDIKTFKEIMDLLHKIFTMQVNKKGNSYEMDIQELVNNLTNLVEDDDETGVVLSHGINDCSLVAYIIDRLSPTISFNKSIISSILDLETIVLNDKYVDFIDVNAPYKYIYGKHTMTALYSACKITIDKEMIKKNDMEYVYDKHLALIELLLSNGANPNIDSETEKPLLESIFETGYSKPSHEHQTNVLKTVIEFNIDNDNNYSEEKDKEKEKDKAEKKNKYTRVLTRFNWDKYVNNYGKNNEGLFNVLLRIARPITLHYVLDFEEKHLKLGNIKNKMDIYGHIDKNGNNTLLIACGMNGSEQKSRYQERIEFLLNRFSFDINKMNNKFKTPFELFCKGIKNKLECNISLFLQYRKNNNKCNVHLSKEFKDKFYSEDDEDDDDDYYYNNDEEDDVPTTPFMNIMKGKDFENLIKLIGYQQKVENIEIDSLCDFAYYGDIIKFKQQLYTLVELKYKIKTWDQLTEIINDKNIDIWIEYAQLNASETIVGFLTSLKSKILSTKSLIVFKTFIEDGKFNNVNVKNVESKAGNKNQSVENEKATREAVKRATYLFEHCDKHTLNQLSNVVNNAILKQECGFDDSLLFLSKMVDNDSFVNVLENATSQCLSKDKKNQKSYLYFKNNLLSSKIWGAPTTATTATAETAATTDEKKEETNNKNDDNKLLFEQIRVNVIEKELESQRKFIKESILKEEKEFRESWNKLVNNDIGVKSQSKTKVIQAIKSDYKNKELPYDNVNGFDGSFEYDNNGYLTKLLIATHQIDPIFQKDCKKMFENKENFANVSFSEAPPKTRARSQTKAQLELSLTQNTTKQNTRKQKTSEISGNFATFVIFVRLKT